MADGNEGTGWLEQRLTDLETKLTLLMATLESRLDSSTSNLTPALETRLSTLLERSETLATTAENATTREQLEQVSEKMQTLVTSILQALEKLPDGSAVVRNADNQDTEPIPAEPPVDDAPGPQPEQHPKRRSYLPI